MCVCTCMCLDVCACTHVNEDRRLIFNCCLPESLRRGLSLEHKARIQASLASQFTSFVPSENCNDWQTTCPPRCTWVLGMRTLVPKLACQVLYSGSPLVLL